MPPTAAVLRPLVRLLAEDFLVRATTEKELDAGLRGVFAQMEQGGRTAQAFETWRDEYLDQVAVAWVLACVFVRFLEDNGLIEECWLAGEGERRRLAEDTHELFFRQYPHDTDREYFQHVFREVGQIPAARDLFAEGKTPLWAVAPSGDAAIQLLKFWREIDPKTGELLRYFGRRKAEGERQKNDSSFRLPPSAFLDTRFLGDLYQDLSETAKKKYALLQTPVFVEEFILDRTLTPAIAEFGLEQVRMIDPTCGSGHFLLGGFARLFDLWSQRENNEIKAAQRALDGVWGVDINPFAVAIARFRLIVAAVQACEIKQIKQAPGWRLHLATGDSLLFGSRWNSDGTKRAETRYLDESWAPDIYACEDKQAVSEVLGQRYHVVVGNPPYITPKDAASRAEYRKRYKTAYDKFHLSTPFTERFFELAIASTGQSMAGFVGLIKDNAFMKRDFGIKLIQEFFPKVDLTHVLDASGVYLPGHGTPTTIIFGRNRPPTSQTVRAVRGIQGEQGTPDDPSKGKVWLSILKQIDIADGQDAFTSSADVARSTFSTHPWGLGGGGAAELKEMLDESASATISDYSTSVGITSVAGEDDVYVFSRPNDLVRLHVTHSYTFVTGDLIRDYVMETPPVAIWPYDKRFTLLGESYIPDVVRVLWPCKASISQRRRFGTPMLLKGAKWYEWQELYDDKLTSPLSLVFAFVATHNHFLLDRGNKVFNRSAPIIKLSADASEDDHLALLGLLNSSIACFWMKQVFFPKGGDHVGQEGARVRRTWWDERYEFAATQMLNFPLPEARPLSLSRQLDQLAQQYAAQLPESVTKSSTPTSDRIDQSRKNAELIRGQMIALQEELDWHCYQLYGLVSDDLRYSGENLPELALGHRAFEIVMGRQMVKGELETAWFERHGSTPITEIPSQWPAAYRTLVDRRIKLIETNKEIALLEKPEYKRRWNTEPWEEQEQRALKNWLLDRLETPKYRKGTKDQPELTSTAQMADAASTDAEFLQVAALYRGRSDFDVAALVAELVETEAVPLLPILRYKPTGLRKREVWERTWDLQRQQDAGKDVGEIPVPPKYTNSSGKVDFLKPDYWRLRGGLDVPKERWVSYPHCSTDSDGSLVVGWAGWNHLEQATALVAYYDARKREGWDSARLTPLLAGLDQLLPWIHQWHPEIDPEFGETAGQSFQALLEAETQELGLTVEAVRKWEGGKQEGGRRKAKGGKRKADVE